MTQDDVVLDIGEDGAVNDERSPLLSSLKNQLKSLSFPSDRRCIYRVPERLREVNPNAYTPKVVSIGPLHHGAKKLAAMENHKRRYLYHLIKEFKLNLEDLVRCVKNREQELRECYSETIMLSSDKFSELILVDAAFVIEFLLRMKCRAKQSTDDIILDRPWQILEIKRDMILLENQLPLFILVDILGMIPRYTANARAELTKFAASVLIRQYVDINLVNAATEKFTLSEAEHFLHMMLICYQPFDTEQSRGELEIKAVPRAVELRRFGIDIKARSCKRFIELRFQKGLLEIPSLRILDSTEYVLRNLVAFEQCHTRQYNLSDYICLMAYLINTTEDAELLIQKNIILNGSYSPTKVSTMLVRIGVGTIVNFKKFSYFKLGNDLNAHCNNKHNKWKAHLKQRYLHNPWKILSIAAAIVLLVLTFLQTIFTGIATF